MNPTVGRFYGCSDLQQHVAYLEQLHVILKPTAAVSPEKFHTTFAARHFPKTYVARVRYGAAVQVTKTEPGWSLHHVLSMPVAGCLRSVSNNPGDVAHPERFTLRAPVPEQRFETTEQTDEFFLAVNPSYLRAFCARILGRPLHSEIEFAPMLSPQSPHGRAIRAASELCLNGIEGAPEDAQSRFDVEFQDFFATTLLMHQPHNFSDELSGRAPLPAPHDVKRALDYIHANLADSICLEDLIEVSNVPGRTLNEHFRRFLGVSPMCYVKQERLKLAREMLTRAKGTSVTAVAMHCGFFHLGRFSVEYKRAFDESPSETRTRRRGP